ncbi:MAG: phage portal protein [Eggerthellaceae bacterium]|nr:phage portal protein [Eggerthellaceae bacterium]
MLFLNTETARINRLISEGAGRGLTETQFFAKEIVAWKNSPERKEQIHGTSYYSGKHDILDRKRTTIGPDGKLVPVDNIPNNKIIDNQYAKMVDQKTNYLLGKPFTITCENKAYAEQLKKRFNKAFQRMIKYVGEDCLNGGKCWLFVYYNDKGEMCYRRFPAFQILPFWADDDHTILDAAARLYLQEVWEGYTKKIVERVEIYKPDGIYRYILDGSVLIPDVELGDYSPYITVKNGENVEPYNWDRLPLICFKYNKEETPLIRRVKSLQDGINLLLSDFQNNMEENARNTILVLKNYDGQDLGEFRHNLSTFAAVKVRDDGGVETLTVEVNAENYKAILELFKKALIENARGYDAKDDRLSGNPNQMNIQSMYSDIDLDANGMETEFQAAFDDLLWFINQDLKTKGAGDFEQDDVTIVFNRDILINETEAIQNCSNSVGILSNETIVEQHPWTTDVEMELKRLKKEQQEELEQAQEYSGAFGAGTNQNREPGGGE